MTTGRGVGPSSRRLLFIFIYIILLFHISGYIGNEMATATLSVSMAIVEEGRLTIDSYTDGARELSYHNGHFFSGMPPGQSFIATPLYFVVRPALSVAADAIAPRLRHIEAATGYHLDEPFAVRRLLLLIIFTVLLSAPCAAATCVMVVDLAEILGQRVGILGALLLPLCTIWWTYGTEYGPRIMGGFLLLLPIWWVFVRRDAASGRRGLIMAAVIGAGLVFAPLIRYELVVAAVPLGIWTLTRLKPRQIAAFVLAASVVIGVAMAYHNHCYGSPTAIAYSKKLWPADVVGYWHDGPVEEMHHIYHDGTDWVVWDQKEFISVTPRVVIEGLWGNREALLRFSPFLLLVPVGLVISLRNGYARHATLLFAGLVCISIVILLLMPHPGFRGAIGPRYMLWILPAAVLLALPAWNRIPSPARWGLFVASFIPSCFAAMLGAHARGAWTFRQLGEFGLTNYTLSRAQLAGLFSPAISTAVVLVFWAIMAVIFLRPGSRWCLYRTETADDASTDQTEER